MTCAHECALAHASNDTSKVRLKGNDHDRRKYGAGASAVLGMCLGANRPTADVLVVQSGFALESVPHETARAQVTSDIPIAMTISISYGGRRVLPVPLVASVRDTCVRPLAASAGAFFSTPLASDQGDSRSRAVLASRRFASTHEQPEPIAHCLPATFGNAVLDDLNVLTAIPCVAESRCMSQGLPSQHRRWHTA